MVIDLDFDFMGGADAAAERVRHLIGEAIGEVGSDPAQGVVEERTRRGGQYVIAQLEPAVIRHVAETDREAGQEARGASRPSTASGRTSRSGRTRPGRSPR